MLYIKNFLTRFLNVISTVYILVEKKIPLVESPKPETPSLPSPRETPSARGKKAKAKRSDSIDVLKVRLIINRVLDCFIIEIDIFQWPVFVLLKNNKILNADFSSQTGSSYLGELMHYNPIFLS